MQQNATFFVATMAYICGELIGQKKFKGLPETLERVGLLLIY